jgi:membrane protease YdiL (CAAX protease family)
MRILELIGFLLIYAAYLMVWTRKSPTFAQVYPIPKAFLRSTAAKAFLIASALTLSFLSGRDEDLLANFGLRRRFSLEYALLGIGLGIGLLLVLFLIGGLLQRFLKGQERAAEAFFQSFPAVTAYLWIFLLAVQAAVTEELIFRGYLLNLSAEVMPLGGAVVLQASLFGSSHFKQGLPGVLQSAIIGLIWGVLVVFYNSLLVSIAAHFVGDWLGISLQYRMWSKTKGQMGEN